MAGKRQHFIPRFLQRGFSIEKDGRFFSCLCKREFVKENIVIENIGLENKFYTLNGDSSVDDKITENETYIYSKIAHDLISGTFNMADKESISNFICHMETRTKSCRSNFINATSYLIDQIKVRLISKDALSRFFNRNIISNPEKIDSLLNEQLNKLNIPHVIRSPIKEIFYNNIHAWLSSITHELEQKLIPLFEHMVMSDIPDAAKKGHLKALELNINKKIEEYAKLNYKVIKVEDLLILGDCLVVFEIDGERGFKPNYEKGDVLKALYMPINSHTILYGSRSLNDNPKIENINRIIAECSTDFFICEKLIPDIKNIKQVIGSNSYLLTDEAIDAILDELIDETI